MQREGGALFNEKDSGRSMCMLQPAQQAPVIAEAVERGSEAKFF